MKGQITVFFYGNTITYHKKQLFSMEAQSQITRDNLHIFPIPAQSQREREGGAAQSQITDFKMC